jgi:leucyl-tRNA synthetase
LIDFSEPFKTLRNQGMILAPDGQKMSKSKGNTIEPDGLIEQGYGADAIRIMELFIGPWNQSVNWSVEGLGGSFRFLQRIWVLGLHLRDAKLEGVEDRVPPSETALALVEQLPPLIHATIKRVTQDIENLSFNTAIAALMEYVNRLYKLGLATEPIHRQNLDVWHTSVETLLKLLAPFAPHITEELWSQIMAEDRGSIHHSEWPKYDERYLISHTTTIVVQVNGKVRAELRMAPTASEEEVTAAAREHERIKPYLEGQDLKKTIYVSGRLVNLVV